MKTQVEGHPNFDRVSPRCESLTRNYFLHHLPFITIQDFQAHISNVDLPCIDTAVFRGSLTATDPTPSIASRAFYLGQNLPADNHGKIMLAIPG